MTLAEESRRPPLQEAVVDGNIEGVHQLLAAGADVNAQDQRGWTALHFAAQANAVEITNLLLHCKARVEIEDKAGNTSLFTATFNSKGSGEIIRLLRAAGADPKKKNKRGVSPLSLAQTMANYDVAQFYGDLIAK